MEDLFDECFNDEKYREAKKKDSSVIVDNLINTVEAEFTGLSTTVSERKAEKHALTQKLKTLKTQLSSIKNPSNLAKMPATKRESITKKLSEEREKIRKQIKQCQIRLDEIEIEENPNPQGNDNNDKPCKADKKWDANPYSDFY